MTDMIVSTQKATTKSKKTRKPITTNLSTKPSDKQTVTEVELKPVYRHPYTGKILDAPLTPYRPKFVCKDCGGKEVLISANGHCMGPKEYFENVGKYKGCGSIAQFEK